MTLLMPRATLDAALVMDPQLRKDVDRAVKSAAYAAECPMALFFAKNADGFEACATVGCDPSIVASVDHRMLQEIADIRNGGFRIANDLLVASDIDRLFGATTLPVRFFAALPVLNGDDATLGVLVVADGSPHAGLSAAKTYVLRSQAAQISALLELQVLRGMSAVAMASRSASERLRLLESVVVNANDAVLITQAEPIDLPGPRIIYCNAAFTKTTGYSEAEVLGQTPRMLQSSLTDRATLDRLRAALQAWKPVEVELLNRRKDGTPFWVELSIAPVANEKGWFTHWVSVQRDVSDRKTAEETAIRVRIAEAENAVLAAEIQERKRVEEQLVYAAFHDDLTKLRNRAYFMDRLASALELTRVQPGFRCAVLFMDLDRFKLVNDSLGHRAGDLLLMEVAHRLRTCLKPQSTIARVGGDEFAILLERFEEMDDVIALTRGVIATMRRPLWLGNQEIFTSCSVGVVEATRSHASPEELLRDADIAMYQAKRRDTDGYAIFAAPMHESAVEALHLQTDLRNALLRSEFFLDFQPICDAVTSEVVGVEALIRWQHPQRGLVQPDAFIPIAEETGLIREIGRWALKESCTRMRAWQSRFPGLDLRLSINTSGVELEDRNFKSEVLETLASNGVAPESVQLEVTESIFLRQPALIGKVLGDIRATGIKIALDDFGTGYSSLSYLDRYQFDTIKIDRSFVACMLSRRRTMAIVEGIVGLAQALDLAVVAEGVETVEQLHALGQTGCSFVQGYLLGHPMSAENLEAVLSEKAARKVAAAA